MGQQLRYDGALPTGTTWAGPVAGSVDVTYGAVFRPLNILVNAQELSPFQFFDYDNDGLPIQVGNLSLGYRGDNGLLELVAGAGQAAFWSYDSLGQVATYAVLNQSTSDTTFRAAYAYDRLGRITELRERVQTDTATLAFAYDSAGRLAEVRRGGVLTASYEYDLNGNRTRRTTPLGTEVGAYDDQDRLLSYGNATYAYTANGELREKVEGSDTTRYRYDAFGNLREVFLPDGTHIEYVIDGQQRRIGRKVNGVLVQGWLYQSQLAIVAEVDGLGNVTKTFEYGTRVNVPEVMRVGSTVYRLVTDHLGSVRLVINASTGQVAQRLEYDEYGRVTLNTNSGFQPFGYAGGLLETGARLVRFGARDYDAAVGRWTAPDPLGFGVGGLNLWSYVSSNPINSVDVTGLSVFGNCIAGAGSYFAGLASYGRHLLRRFGLLGECERDQAALEDAAVERLLRLLAQSPGARALAIRGLRNALASNKARVLCRLGTGLGVTVLLTSVLSDVGLAAGVTLGAAAALGSAHGLVEDAVDAVVAIGAADVLRAAVLGR